MYRETRQALIDMETMMALQDVPSSIQARTLHTCSAGVPLPSARPARCAVQEKPSAPALRLTEGEITVSARILLA
jgi:hypothetical protein